MKTGILGGTFNPVHNAHLFVAQEVSIKLNLKKIFLIPDNIPPHKNYKNEIKQEQRLEMLKIATKDNELFSVLDIELKRGGVSYTIDTVQEIYNKYNITEKAVFIIGADLLPELNLWKDIDKLKELVKFVVYGRNDENVDRILKDYTWVDKISGPEMDISSSMIRQRIKENKSIKYLVPENVREYMKKNSLYL